jgi:hypothetical protein
MNKIQDLYLLIYLYIIYKLQVPGSFVVKLVVKVQFYDDNACFLVLSAYSQFLDSSSGSRNRNN